MVGALLKRTPNSRRSSGEDRASAGGAAEERDPFFRQNSHLDGVRFMNESVVLVQIPWYCLSLCCSCGWTEEEAFKTPPCSNALRRTSGKSSVTAADGRVSQSASKS